MRGPSWSKHMQSMCGSDNHMVAWSRSTRKRRSHQGRQPRARCGTYHVVWTSLPACYSDARVGTKTQCHRTSVADSVAEVRKKWPRTAKPRITPILIETWPIGGSRGIVRSGPAPIGASTARGRASTCRRSARPRGRASGRAATRWGCVGGRAGGRGAPRARAGPGRRARARSRPGPRRARSRRRGPSARPWPRRRRPAPPPA